jgi:hypothetical protein
MEPIDLTASDSEEGFLSFGSKATEDDDSVEFLVEVSNFSSDDESVGKVGGSEHGNMRSMVVLIIVDYCVNDVGEKVEEFGDVDTVESETADILSAARNDNPVVVGDIGELNLFP